MKVFHEYQYTSPPVYLCISIPVTPKKRQYTSLSVYQSLRNPVYQSTCIPVTKIPVYQSLPSPRYHHLMSAPLAAVVYESSPLAAVVISTWTTSVPTALVWNWDLKDHYHTALVKIPGLQDPLAAFWGIGNTSRPSWEFPGIVPLSSWTHSKTQGPLPSPPWNLPRLPTSSLWIIRYPGPLRRDFQCEAIIVPTGTQSVGIRF